MSLGQYLTQLTIQFILSNLFLFVLFLSIVILGNNIYYNLLRTNKETDNVDLMARYLWLKMARRYNGNRH